jgi:hypothetical protein
MTDAGLMGKASIDWDYLDADDHENLERLTAPYWAIDEARGGQGAIGRPVMRASSLKAGDTAAREARTGVYDVRRTERVVG